MEVATFHYARGAWSRSFPALDSAQTLVMAFAAPAYHDRPGLLAELAAAYPASVVVGCSTSGEIDHTEIRDDSITVGAIRFAGTRVKRAVARLASVADSFDSGVAIANELVAEDLRAVLVLSEGLHVNGSELVRGINARLDEEVVVTGGLAGDGDRFGRTWVLADGRPEANGVVAVGLYGERVRIGHGSKGGWDTFGPERVVTRSLGNVLYTLDDRPALALYKEYLGERAAGLPGSALLFPLALRQRNDEPNSVVRTVLSVDEATQSMTFAGDIPVGHYAKLMRANFDRLILGAQAAGSAAARHDLGTPALSIAISCVGRRLVLGERSEEETEATLEALPALTQQIGFYSYGEISPHVTGRCDLHNQTMTLTVLSESP
ncbi:MAG TPA: FIST N-terminal domain-containing protein [Kofleriaceae bacterium]|nr:FIST N-terminal domain-containing protein [Kofleriaceae bacterium]